MENEEIVKDFGSIKVPTKWEEVTLKQYQDIERYYADKEKKVDIREILHIFTGLSEDDINLMPTEFLDKIMEKLLFLQTKPEEKKPVNNITINGEVYTVHTENKLKTGEYVASDTVMKGDRHNYAAILAILCRKEGELFDSRFENEVLLDRIKMFEEAPIVDVLPIISFFLSLYMIYQTPILLSTKTREAINLIRKDIETSVTNGEVSKRSTKSVMKKLKKLEKSINSI